MTLDADMLADRRRLKRRTRLWRAIAIAVAVVAIVVIGDRAAGDGSGWLGSDQIARYVIDGTITDDRKEQELLDEIADSDARVGCHGWPVGVAGANSTTTPGA